MADNRSLDHRDNTADGFGYCVFGKVVAGMAVVDKIRNVRTHTVGMFGNVPINDVVILSARRVK